VELIDPERSMADVPSLPAVRWYASFRQATVMSLRCPWCGGIHHHPRDTGWNADAEDGVLMRSHCGSVDAPPAYRLTPVTVAQNPSPEAIR